MSFRLEHLFGNHAHTSLRLTHFVWLRIVNGFLTTKGGRRMPYSTAVRYWRLDVRSADSLWISTTRRLATQATG
jgi:hypothetical protein